MENLSNFPREVDSFTELYDLPPRLVVSAKRYQELKTKPSLNANEQSELNSLVTELGDYIITPQTWNKFASSLVNMQQFIKNEVDGYIDGKQAEWAGYVKAFKSAGVYNASTQYRFQNMVTYNGDLYLCVKDAKGVVPTNTTYWQKISTKGDKGDVGLNTYFKGSYDSTKAYSLGDAVLYKGIIYYAKVASSAGQSPEDASKWVMFDKMYVGKEAPANVQQGLTWIEVE